MLIFGMVDAQTVNRILCRPKQKKEIYLKYIIWFRICHYNGLFLDNHQSHMICV